MERNGTRLRPEVLTYYESFDEDGRLRDGPDRLELLRTQDILRRWLPPAPATVLDVGGGTGVHAEWLVRDGHRVRLLDPMVRHVELAAEVPGLDAAVGDARHLDEPDGAYDCVLLLGPLYHLVERSERLTALRELGGWSGPAGWLPRRGSHGSPRCSTCCDRAEGRSRRCTRP